MEIEFINALETVKFIPKLVSTYEDINFELPLLKDVYVPGNTHLGQRKLLLSSIQFYSRLPEHSTVIYAGSAPGVNCPALLELFPTLNFILIDPHFHFFNYDYQYIYKKIHPTIKESGYKYGKNPHIDKLIDMVRKKKCGDSMLNALSVTSFGNESLGDFKGFNECRVFVIQDYVSYDLALKLKKRLGEISKDPIFYVSDIRSSNNDSNILFDNALQLIVQRALSEDFDKGLTPLAQYKFVLPKYNSPLIVEDWMHDVFKKAKEFGYDFLADYPTGTYKYLDGEILLQAWARPLSGETRLLTYGLTNRIYDPMEWRRKFNYHNFYRAYCYNPAQFLLFPKRRDRYCGCSDCNLEMHIIDEYTHMSSKSFEMVRDLIDRVTNYSFKGHKLPVRDSNTVFFFETYNKKYKFVRGKVVSL